MRKRNGKREKKDMDERENGHEDQEMDEMDIVPMDEVVIMDEIRSN